MTKPLVHNFSISLNRYAAEPCQSLDTVALGSTAANTSQPQLLRTLRQRGGSNVVPRKPHLPVPDVSHDHMTAARRLASLVHTKRHVCAGCGQRNSERRGAEPNGAAILLAFPHPKCPQCRRL
jgi:hypothetical protein